MFSSFWLIGVAILLFFLGSVAASSYIPALKFAGAPGVYLAAALSRKSKERKVPMLGVLVTVLGQTYASLAFVAAIILSVRSLVGDTTGIGKWILWVVAFYIAVVPAFLAWGDAILEWAINYEGLSAAEIVPHHAIRMTLPLTTIGFFIFVFVPSLMSWGWGWVPHF